MKKIRIAGPPGTGKTTTLVETYYSHLEEYSPANIIVISHTNTAADHIRDKIYEDKSIEEYQKRTGKEVFGIVKLGKETLKQNVTTIHKFCKNRVVGKAFLIEDYEILINLKPIFDKHTKGRNFNSVQALFALHPFFKFVSFARDNGQEVLKYYRSLSFEEKEDYKYDPEELIFMKKYYDDFKTNEKINGRAKKILDFQDMVEDFYINEEESQKKCTQMKVLIVDEAQDSSVIQRKAEEVMSKNVDYFYKAGDPDQSIFEFAGADPHSFHLEFAKPEIELKQGYRCPRVVNEYCKKIIKDVWDEYEYERVWAPLKDKNTGQTIEGEIHYLSDLTQDPFALELKNRILDTDENFVFTYRGGEPKEILRYLVSIGAPFQLPAKDNLKFNIKYPAAEIKNQREYKTFVKGEIKSRAKVKSMLKSMVPEYVLKTMDELEQQDRSSFDIDWLVENSFVIPGIKKTQDFQTISKIGSLQIKNYIRDIVNNDRDLKNKRVFIENIHTIKGKEFDNVVFDFKLTRQEETFSKKRMKFVACSRAKKTLWLLKSSSRLSFLGKEDQ